MQNPTISTISPAALATATRNADAQGDRYAVAACDIFDGAVNVFRAADPTGHNYRVWLPGALSGYPEGKCNCPYFEKEGCWKHVVLAVRVAEFTARVVARLEEMEADALVGAGDPGKF